MLVRLATVFLFALGACKGDRGKCEQAARNYATLVFHKNLDAELAKLPEAERDAHRKKRLSEFTNEIEGHIDMVTAQCVSANNTEQIDCMVAAKTADQALECADVASPPKK